MNRIILIVWIATMSAGCATCEYHSDVKRLRRNQKVIIQKQGETTDKQEIIIDALIRGKVLKYTK